MFSHPSYAIWTGSVHRPAVDLYNLPFPNLGGVPRKLFASDVGSEEADTVAVEVSSGAPIVGCMGGVDVGLGGFPGCYARGRARDQGPTIGECGMSPAQGRVVPVWAQGGMMAVALRVLVANELVPLRYSVETVV